VKRYTVALIIIGVIFLFSPMWWLALLAIVGYVAYRVTRFILMKKYFESEEFLAKKAEINAVVAEHNDVALYVAEIRETRPFELGASSTGAQAHLAQYENTSKNNYKRDRNSATYGKKNVHNCSLQTVRNAKADPVTYLMKYFGIKANEEQLAEVENLGESIARLEAAVSNLKEREAGITETLNPPKFIVKHYNDRFMQEIGVELSPITVPYSTYVFEYVSAGGNSAQRTSITMDAALVDALVETLSAKVKFAKSAAGQRALMTSRLRNAIKERDEFTCQTCSVSTQMEEHLLLEVDHIIPVSKGGQSTETNLQTLCWRCNRSKSNKIL
jgi:hypothetical protein